MPNWRKTNLKKSLSISKKKGGGVLLELSHELDYMIWLFGKPKYLRAVIDRKNFFSKTVEEKVCVFFYYPKKMVQMDMSLNSRVEERNIVVNALKGSIKADFIKKNITQYENNKSKIVFRTKQNNFEMLYNQMSFMLSEVKKNKKINNVFQSLELIKIISKIKQSKFNNKKILI